MSASSRYLAFFSYLLSLPGALFVLFARRNDAFAVFHARQSLVQSLIGIITPLVWAVLAWVIAWIPLVGPMISICLFGLMLAVFLLLIFDWIIGMVYALKGRVLRTPVAGPIAIRQRRGARPVPFEVAETSPEMIERTTPIDV